MFSILHKLRRTGFFGNGRSVIRYKPNGSNKRSMNYLKLQAIIIFNDLGLIYLTGSRSYIWKLERTAKREWANMIIRYLKACAENKELKISICFNCLCSRMSLWYSNMLVTKQCFLIYEPRNFIFVSDLLRTCCALSHYLLYFQQLP